MLSAQYIITVSISVPTCFLNFNLKKRLVVIDFTFISWLVYVKYLETKSYSVSSEKSTEEGGQVLESNHHVSSRIGYGDNWK